MHVIYVLLEIRLMLTTPKATECYIPSEILLLLFFLSLSLSLSLNYKCTKEPSPLA